MTRTPFRSHLFCKHGLLVCYHTVLKNANSEYYNLLLISVLSTEGPVSVTLGLATRDIYDCTYSILKCIHVLHSIIASRLLHC